MVNHSNQPDAQRTCERLYLAIEQVKEFKRWTSRFSQDPKSWNCTMYEVELNAFLTLLQVRCHLHWGSTEEVAKQQPSQGLLHERQYQELAGFSWQESSNVAKVQSHLISEQMKGEMCSDMYRHIFNRRTAYNDLHPMFGENCCQEFFLQDSWAVNSSQQAVSWSLGFPHLK